MTATAGAQAAERFRHEAFFYRDLDDFVLGTSAFVSEGLSAGEAVMVALPPRGVDALSDALGTDAQQVEFLDMYALGANPARIIPAWLSFAAENSGAGRGFRGIGEPLWLGRRTTEIPECHLHERLLNTAFDDGPAWQLLCPYDATSLPPAAVAGALHSHPMWSGTEAKHASDHYDGPAGARAAFAEPLPAAPPEATTIAFDGSGLVELRELVGALARMSGLATARCDELVLAASELATNSVRYGGGTGTLRHWADSDALVLDFQDSGRIDDVLAGRRLPSLTRDGGRGLFIVNQVCDFVQTRSGTAGTTVRVTTWL